MEQKSMTPEQFCYWLQGWFEIANKDNISETETYIIKEHLKLVFTKKTPEFPVMPAHPRLIYPNVVPTPISPPTTIC